MRTYLKSLGSFSWILSLFGLKQLGELLMSPVRRRRAAGEGSGLEALTRSLEEHLGPTLQAIFRSGDRILRSVMDLAMGRPRRPPAPPWRAEAPDLHGPPPAGGPPGRSPAGPPPPGSPPGSPPASGWGPMPPIPEPPATAGPAGKNA